MTVTVDELGGKRKTGTLRVVVPALPSACAASPIENSVTASSFWIVPWPCGSMTMTVPPPGAGLLMLTKNVSSTSGVVSPTTSIVMVCDVASGGMRKLLASGAKSPGAVAEPLAARRGRSGPTARR